MENQVKPTTIQPVSLLDDSIKKAFAMEIEGDVLHIRKPMMVSVIGASNIVFEKEGGSIKLISNNATIRLYPVDKTFSIVILR